MIKFSINNDFQPYYKVEKGTGRRFVIPDIHGFYDTFVALLEKIQFSKNDQLFLLGDYIDKGKKGKEVLNFIIEMIENEQNIYPLRGNHEDMYLTSHFRKRDEDSQWVPTLNRTKGIRDKEKKLFPKYLAFIEKLPYYYELDNFYLVHAGIDFTKDKPLEDYSSMMWIREFEIDESKTNGKTIIHGHSKRTLSVIKNSITKREIVIGLDNTSPIITDEELGSLVCLNLDTFELTVERCKESDTKKKFYRMP